MRHKQPSDTIFSESRLVITGLCVCSIMSICLLDLLVQSLKIYIADLSIKMLFGLMLISTRDPAHFQEWRNPGKNKLIPGIAHNCPGVVTPLNITLTFTSRRVNKHY